MKSTFFFDVSAIIRIESIKIIYKNSEF